MKFLYYSIFILFLLSSCSNTKYLHEGELLYVKGKVMVDKIYREQTQQLPNIISVQIKSGKSKHT